MGATYGDSTYGDGTYGAASVAVVLHPAAGPSLELHVEVEKPDGRTIRLAPESAPDRMAVALRFTTKRQEGFDTGQFSLPRHVLSESQDLELYDTVRFVAADGTVAYEGRVAAMPRQLDDTHSIDLECQGWMAHARDSKFREIYVDRDLGRWTGMSTQRRVDVVGLTPAYGIFDPQTEADASTGNPSFRTSLQGPWANKAICEGSYDAGPGGLIGSVYGAWKRGATINSADTGWDWRFGTSTLDTLSGGTDTGNLRAAGPGTATHTPATPVRYAHVQLQYTPAGAGVEYPIWWTCLAVYGDHGVTKRGVASATEAQGFYVSEVISNIVERFCPKLSAAGVGATDYPHPQVAFHDRTDPYDAMLLLNAIHLWDLAVWENKTLHYYPVDLTDWDWEIRTDDPGVTLQHQGDTVDTLANGICVEFDNVQTGKKDVLHPADHAELRDDGIYHPANKHGLDVVTDASLSIPATQDMALQIGRTMLAELNQAKAPGSFTHKGGFIRDRQGNLQPAWKVRATDTVAITDHPNDRPRLITETSWDQDSKTLTGSFDSTIKRVDAFVDRLETSLKSANLL